jgi:hypothetical protein
LSGGAAFPYNPNSQNRLEEKVSGTAVRHGGPRNTKRPSPVVGPKERRVPRGDSFMEDIEAKSRTIRDPVAKLRYIRESLARYQEADRKVQAVPISPLRWLLYRVTKLDRLRPLYTTNPNGAVEAPRPVAPPVRSSSGAGWAIALVAAAGVALGAYRLSRPADAAAPAASAPSTLPVAETLPLLPQGVAPARIWLVEKGETWELYSNGLRIDTSYGVPGDPRRYRLFDRKAGYQDEIRTKPVGIVFHTSESDIWPLEESFNEKLRDSSQGLLRYLQRNAVYNYLIDRFGRVFRVVSEEGKANHAGNGVWTQADDVYLSLNNSFLGVSFETRWEGGQALPITQAQLAAGRSLTDYLRKKWAIAPEMCVAHGLTSMNPKKHLIGHHLDWSRGFPFEAFGLPNQYARVVPSVELFGFEYDDRFLNVLGEPWLGVREAETALLTEATARSLTVADVRREKQQLFDRWLAEQTRDQEAAAKLLAAEHKRAQAEKSRPSGAPANGG